MITDCNALKTSKNKKDLLPRIHRNPSTEISINFMTRDTEWLQMEQRRDDILRPLIDTMSSDSPVVGYVLEEGVLKKTLKDSITV